MMSLSLAAFVALGFGADPAITENNPDALLGSWKGIDMYQDAGLYDGKTYYLPNDEEIIIEKNRVRVYFYPYFKSDEFEASATSKSIIYSIGKKKVKSDYSFRGDTLILSMHFINKNFIKLYERTTLDQAVIDELNEFGFNPSAIVNEYELDTLHPELRKGFADYDSLGFDPLTHLQFSGDASIRINRRDAASFDRSYQRVMYSYNGVEGEFKVHSVVGTQQLYIVPTTLCQCDSIFLPYINTSWANRIRTQIEEDAR